MQKTKGNKITCKFFGECGSCKLYTLSYQQQISNKKSKTEELFKNYIDNIDLEVYESKQSAFRDRCEFRIWHDGDQISYGMNSYDKKVVCIDSCEIVSQKIQELMPKLLKIISTSAILSQKLFAIEFLSSNSHEDILVTLIYHKKLDQSWSNEAKKILDIQNVSFIGRSRKVKIVLDKEYIKYSIKTDEKEFLMHTYEGSFSQPNSNMNQTMINWVLSHILQSKSDLLELYCGSGNFTLPLSTRFDRVLATEISRTSIRSAKENCTLNDITNIEFVKMSSKELTDALEKKREFVRLKGIDLDSYEFSTVFVDPPRAGLDDKSLRFISKFDNIIYISCNQETLKRDLDYLSKSHKIKHFALFDQFAYTEHIETGVILSSF